MTGSRRDATGGWRNWSGLVSAHPERIVRPCDVDEVAAEVRSARERGSTLKMVGSGHSFSALAATEGTQLTPGGLVGIRAVDLDALTVTVGAGTPISELNRVLERLGLALPNLGDVAVQTVAGAIATGTHGSGGAVASLSAMVVGAELVTGTGEVLIVTRDRHPEILDLVRLSLGALGVLTWVTLQVEPVFVLEAVEQPMAWDRVLGTFDELAAECHHLDLYWFPHTDRFLTKRSVRLDVDPEEAEPPSAWQTWRDDELLTNRVFGLVQAGLHRVPGLTPRVNDRLARTLAPRVYSDVAWRVLTAHRRVVFREMEYAVPRESGPDALREVRRAIEASGLRIGFPVEVRTAPADDVPLSPAYGAPVVYLAFHTWRKEDHHEYFALMEQVMLAHGGRPHWGKLHTLAAEDLARIHPRYGDFTAIRDRLDPDRVFANAELRRVLGD